MPLVEVLLGLKHYNTEQSHQGYWNKGRCPMETVQLFVKKPEEKEAKQYSSVNKLIKKEPKKNNHYVKWLS